MLWKEPYRGVPGSTGDVPEGSWRYGDVPEGTGMYQKVPGCRGMSRRRWKSPSALWRQSSGTAAPPHPRDGTSRPREPAARTVRNGSERDQDRGGAARVLVPALREQLEGQELSRRTSKVAGIGVNRKGEKCRVQGSGTPTNQGTSPVPATATSPAALPGSGLLHPPRPSPHTLL